jgi:hypothetical protein
MTEQDWQRIRRDTERAIEHMAKLIAIAEVGKKKTRAKDEIPSD